MRSHLLNWTLGPALLGAMFASFGGESMPALSAREWLVLLSALGQLALVMQGVGLVLTTLVTIGQRFVDGRFGWPQVRRCATVMAVRMALLAYAMTALVIIHVVAAVTLGGWKGGWLAALVGAGVGFAFGLSSGLVVAWLRIPRRLGLENLENPANSD